jgi:hypothetical protein
MSSSMICLTVVVALLSVSVAAVDCDAGLCNGHGTVTSSGTACGCICTDRWSGPTCNVCDSSYEPTKCNACATGFVGYPTCKRVVRDSTMAPGASGVHTFKATLNPTIFDPLYFGPEFAARLNQDGIMIEAKDISVHYRGGERECFFGFSGPFAAKATKRTLRYAPFSMGLLTFELSAETQAPKAGAAEQKPEFPVFIFVILFVVFVGIVVGIVVIAKITRKRRIANKTTTRRGGARRRVNQISIVDDLSDRSDNSAPRGTSSDDDAMRDMTFSQNTAVIINEQ